MTYAPNGDPERPRAWRYVRFLLLCVALWTIPAIAAAVIYYIRALEAGTASWGIALRIQIMFWYLWVPITPLALWLGRRYSPFEIGHRGRNIGIHTIAAAIISFAQLAVGLLVFRASSPEPPPLPYGRSLLFFLANYFEFDMLIYAGIVITGLAYDYQRRSRREAIRAVMLEAELAEARLESLRMQLHPHFLFNTLHTISALMAKDVPAARRMMTRLSDLLRISLEQEGGDEVPLNEELEFLDRYVEIQRARFSDRLQVDFDIEEEARSVLVPRFLLQPLVENAIRHGADRRPGGGRVEVRARLDDSRLRLEVEDDGPGFRAAREGLREGVGLRSTRARIEHLYKDEARIDLTAGAGGGALVRIDLPARRGGER